MAATLDDEKPWKVDLARRSAQRRDQILHSIEQLVKGAPSFEEALSQVVDNLKKRFARFAAVTAYVADGEDLVVHTALDRPTGPERWLTRRKAMCRRSSQICPADQPGLAWGSPQAARLSHPSAPRPVCGRSWRSGVTSAMRSPLRTCVSWRRWQRRWPGRHPR